MKTLTIDKIAFDGYRNDGMSSSGTVTYSGSYVNDGLGLDVSTGLFVAPRKGLYAFHFRTVTDDGSSTNVKLMHNDNRVASSQKIDTVVSISNKVILANKNLLFYAVNFDFHLIIGYKCKRHVDDVISFGVRIV